MQIQQLAKRMESGGGGNTCGLSFSPIINWRPLFIKILFDPIVSLPPFLQSVGIWKQKQIAVEIHESLEMNETHLQQREALGYDLGKP